MSESRTQHITSHSPEETETIGAALGSRLRGGEVIELVSDLGGGKTTFVRGLARGMGSVDRVVSPTFTLSREYTAGERTLYHFDFYRLHEAGLAADELAEIITTPHAVAIVEWSDVVRHVMPPHTVTITITPLSETEREFIVQYPNERAYLIPGVGP
jgi:tRNA threonylcarbamoyladenosine biosynthesis protein TsaE